MRIARGVLGIVLQCALLTMSLVGSGYACGTHESHAAHMAMGDMPMDDMDMPGMPMPADSPDSPSDSDSDCSFPSSLAGCESMASCAPSAVVVDAPAAVAFAPLSHDEPVWFIEHLRSVTRSPESPPPKA